MSSAAVVIGALRINIVLALILVHSAKNPYSCMTINIPVSVLILVHSAKNPYSCMTIYIPFQFVPKKMVH